MCVYLPACPYVPELLSLCWFTRREWLTLRCSMKELFVYGPVFRRRKKTSLSVGRRFWLRAECRGSVVWEDNNRKGKFWKLSQGTPKRSCLGLDSVEKLDRKILFLISPEVSSRPDRGKVKWFLLYNLQHYFTVAKVKLEEDDLRLRVIVFTVKKFHDTFHGWLLYAYGMSW